MFKRLRIDPFLLALLAVVALATVLPARGAFAAQFAVATKLAIALLFFLHGARLSRKTVIAGITHWRLHLVILAATFGLFPLLGLGFAVLEPGFLPPGLYLGLLYLCLLPSTVQSSIAFTSIAGGNVPAAICAASLSNIAGMFLTPLLAGLLLGGHHSGLGGHGFSWQAVRDILVQLLLPFLAGQALQTRLAGWVAANRMVMMLVDRGSIVMSVYLAFSAAVAEGLWSRITPRDFAILLAAEAVLLAIVLLATIFGSRALGFNRADEIAIAFCGSKKSLVSGAPMANVLFPAASVGAMVLPLLFFHQMQLMVCALLARRWAAKAD